VLEAMACGKPVVGYRGGSVHEVVGDTGGIVPNADMANLIASVERLVADPQRRAAFGEAARRRVAVEYDPRKSLDHLLRIYASIRGGHPAASQ
jgi:glycosyltransferase involved in cell wall biosynthesis